jgi:hypothetical protein
MNEAARVPRGVFLADHIKTLRNDPRARLKIARQHQPLPGAFREAAIALRALIREARKAGEDDAALLSDLYLTGARDSFLHSTPHIPGYGVGYNVVETIPREVWESLEMPYPKIGYTELRLLNKTDQKWLVDAWGEPR